ncbi:sulfurtransferase TusA family protein [Dethiosulfatarculus sandiegensis]|uniref:Preprotein translocase subunit TatB n=1 Tax=Dethiosulfatarculus sandiegensis TaxID=1429043 RepID=A0A0D2JVH7_9BACT|nr:sulfurtransferase TusA family protein [Dethiosulfatarculus sandiegensis]KIX13575.1 preprotein translocase subunit TatB [Dethiosulfatarculus sandiegensis]
MSDIIDARGLSCPQPVILAMDKMKQMKKGVFEVQVDTETSSENVSRAAKSKGWEVKEVREENDAFCLTIAKD